MIYQFRQPARTNGAAADVLRSSISHCVVCSIHGGAGLDASRDPNRDVAALAVKLTSRGPAFYTQDRTGRHGRTFTIYKLRRLVDKCEMADRARWTIPDDPRVTPVGWLARTHIDELPQLFNVLRGEMSLVGPRPERPEFVAESRSRSLTMTSTRGPARHHRAGPGAARSRHRHRERGAEARLRLYSRKD